MDIRPEGYCFVYFLQGVILNDFRLIEAILIQAALIQYWLHFIHVKKPTALLFNLCIRKNLARALL